MCKRWDTPVFEGGKVRALLALGHCQQSVNGLAQRWRQALKHRLEQLGMHVGTQGDDEPFQDGGTGQEDALRSQIVFGLLK